MAAHDIHLACLTRIGNPPGDPDANARGKFQQIFRLKTVHLLAIFTLVYVGTEVTIGGQSDCSSHRKVRISAHDIVLRLDRHFHSERP